MCSCYCILCTVYWICLTPLVFLASAVVGKAFYLSQDPDHTKDSEWFWVQELFTADIPFILSGCLGTLLWIALALLAKKVFGCVDATSRKAGSRCCNFLWFLCFPGNPAISPDQHEHHVH